MLDLVALLPVVPSSGWFRRGAEIGGGAWKSIRAADKAEQVARQGFHSFEAFKAAMGSAGKGRQWHHIVEQSKIGEFSAEMINSVENLINVSEEVNREVNAIYSSKQYYSEGKTVREWLKGKSWEEQYKFGEETIEEVKKAIREREQKEYWDRVLFNASNREQ